MCVMITKFLRHGTAPCRQLMKYKFSHTSATSNNNVNWIGVVGKWNSARGVTPSIKKRNFYPKLTNTFFATTNNGFFFNKVGGEDYSYSRDSGY